MAYSRDATELMPSGDTLQLSNVSMVYVVNGDHAAGSFNIQQIVEGDAEEIVFDDGERVVEYDEVVVADEDFEIESTAEMNFVVVGDLVRIENNGISCLSIGWDARSRSLT